VKAPTDGPVLPARLVTRDTEAASCVPTLR
jgi:hypothetical protein